MKIYISTILISNGSQLKMIGDTPDLKHAGRIIYPIWAGDILAYPWRI